MGAALVLLLVGLGAMAAGVLIGRYYVPDDRQLRRTARHSRAYMRALSHLVARDYETVMAVLRARRDVSQPRRARARDPRAPGAGGARARPAQAPAPRDVRARPRLPRR